MRNTGQAEHSATKNERSCTRKKRGRIVKKSIITACSLILGLSTVWSAHTYAADAAKRIYEYDADGRLTTIYSRDEKVTLSYDDNGNMINKSVEKGDYSSITNPAPPAPPPAPTPTPAPTPAPPPDPSVVPPPVPVPAKANLSTMIMLDQVTQVSAQSNGTITLYGWYLDPVGIQKVEVYIDGVYHGRANMGGSREDVYKVYPAYNNHVAGYSTGNIEIKTEGGPRKKENNKGKKVVVPGQFNHLIEIQITNKANVVTKTSIIFTAVLSS